MDSINDQPNDPKRNFGLTANEFEERLNQLMKGDEKLFEIIFKAHFEKCRSFLVRQFNADDDIAYDVTLDTLVKFRKNLMTGKIKYGNLAALFTIDARNNYLRLNKKEARFENVSIEGQEDYIADDSDTGNLNTDLIEKLKASLRQIGTDCYELLNWHYYLKMPLRTIAENRLQRGEEKFINESSVKTKVAECRKKLRQLLS